MKNFFIFLILFTSFIVNGDNQKNQVIISGLIANNYLTANPFKKYHPINLIDDDENTFWVENYSNTGVDAECNIFFDSPFNLDEIEILGGCFTDDFQNYNRLKTINIIIDEDSNFNFAFDDSKKAQRLKLPQILVKKSLKFKINAVYASKKENSHTAVSEIKFRLSRYSSIYKIRNFYKFIFLIR